MTGARQRDPFTGDGVKAGFGGKLGRSRFWGDFPIMPRYFVFMLQHWADLIFLFEKFDSFLRNIYLVAV